MKYSGISLIALMLLIPNEVFACGLFASRFQLDDPGSDDLCILSDEFNDPLTLANWQRLWQFEGWPGDQLQEIDVGITRPGFLTMLPYTSSWFQDLRGVLAFKLVSGDFVVSTRFQATNRAGTGAPERSFSLAGLFVRQPRPITSPAEWTPGGENYIFLSAGSANQPGTYQYEVKTTQDSDSVLQISPACQGPCAAAPVFELRAARLEDDHFILLRREPGSPDWQVHRRYPRSDLAETLQVGLTTYTDWENIAGPYWPDNQFGHNNTVITDGNPDLLAQFDHVRFLRPIIPPGLAGRDFSADYDPGNPDTVSDAELLDFLGEEVDLQ